MRIDPKPTVPEVLPIALEYYEDHPMGGSLHVVLEDGNVADKHVLMCAEWAAEKGDVPGLRLARILLRMSRPQRSRLGRLLHDNYA